MRRAGLALEAERPVSAANKSGKHHAAPRGASTLLRALPVIVLLGWLPMLVACGDGGDDSADPRSPETASGEFAGTIRLGAALSETGTYAVEGKDSRQGYDTWLRWVNDVYGGIRVSGQRYRAEIVYYDDESDADTAGNLIQRLIDDDRVDFLLGPYSSGLTTGTSAIAEANNVLMVEGNGTSDTMFERGFQNLFLVATIASDYTRSGIEALAARGARTAVIAHEDTSFASAVAQGAARHLVANGIEVLAVETYPQLPQAIINGVALGGRYAVLVLGFSVIWGVMERLQSRTSSHFRP